MLMRNSVGRDAENAFRLFFVWYILGEASHNMKPGRSTDGIEQSIGQIAEVWRQTRLDQFDPGAQGNADEKCNPV